MPQKKEPLKDIRSTLLTRGLSLAKASLKAGGMAAREWLQPGAEGQRPVWLGQAEALISQLGELKGTAMKVGQTLSMYGEHLLPKEVNDVLKTLQQDSPVLAWEAILPVLQSELGEERLSQLEIDHEPIAAASIGQVYRARLRATGEDLALKVQYPGVDRAVDTDLKLLKFILNISDLVPRGPRFDQIFAEIRTMFLQEVNYDLELEFGKRFSDWLGDDPRYVVPKVFPTFSTRRVLTQEFISGARIDSAEVKALSQERRDRLGLAFLDLYLHELLEFRFMQTDPHLGNYRIQIDPVGESDRLVLFDFGAAREVPSDFLASYKLLMEGGLLRDRRLVEKGGRQLGLLQPEDAIELVDDYIELCFLLVEPFAGGPYDWSANDLPKRVAKQVSRIALSHKLRTPPRELIFLDRKLAGVFIFLSVLGCKMDGRELVLARLKSSSPLPSRE